MTELFEAGRESTWEERRGSRLFLLTAHGDKSRRCYRGVVRRLRRAYHGLEAEYQTYVSHFLRLSSRHRPYYEIRQSGVVGNVSLLFLCMFASFFLGGAGTSVFGSRMAEDWMESCPDAALAMPVYMYMCAVYPSFVCPPRLFLPPLRPHKNAIDCRNGKKDSLK